MIRIIFISIIIFFSTLFYSIDANTQTYNIQMKIFNQQNDDGYTYQIVNVDGIWWLYVYDADGYLIEKIPIDE